MSFFSTISGILNPVQAATDWSLAHQKAPYFNTATSIFSLWDEGVIAQPVAGPVGTPAVAIKLYAARGDKVVAFFARRMGSKPVLPAREPNTAAQVFAQMVMFVDEERRMPDGKTPLFEFSGFYRYLLLLPPAESTGYAIPLGQSVEPGKQTATLVTANDFSTAILGTPPAPPVLLNVQGPL